MAPQADGAGRSWRWTVTRAGRFAWGRRAASVFAVGAAGLFVLSTLSGCTCAPKEQASGRLGPAEADHPPDKAPAIRLRAAAVRAGLGDVSEPVDLRVTNVFLVDFSPDGSRIGAIAGRTDDQAPGLWVAPAAGGRPTKLREQASGMAFQPGTGGWIAVTSLGRDGLPEVGVVSVSGAAYLKVAASAVGPIWSADGGRLAYLSASDIEAQTVGLSVASLTGSGDSFVVEAAGVPVVPLVRSVVPAWGGADGRTLFFADAKTGRLAVAVVTPDGKASGAPRVVTGGAAVDELRASANGALVSFLEVSRAATASAEGLSLPAVGRARVYSAATGAVSAPFGDLELTHPRISSDGRRIWAAVDGGVVVADMPSQGAKAGSRGFIPMGRMHAYLPTPSPDGKRVAVISPESDVAAAVVTADLAVYATSRTYLVHTAELARGADVEPALERLHALEPASEDATREAFAPGYPAAFSSDALPGLTAGRLVVAAGRYDDDQAMQTMVDRLRKAGLKPRTQVVGP